MYFRRSFYWLLPVTIVGATLGIDQANAGAFASACSGFDEGGCIKQDGQSGPNGAYALAGDVFAAVLGPSLSLDVVPYSPDPTFLPPLGGATAQWSDYLTFFVGNVVAGLNGSWTVQVNPMSSVFLSPLIIELTDNAYITGTTLDGLSTDPNAFLQFSATFGNHSFTLSSNVAPSHVGPDTTEGDAFSIGPYGNAIDFSMFFYSYPSDPVPFNVSATATAFNSATVKFHDPMVFTVRDEQGDIIPNVLIQSASGAIYSVTDGFVLPSGPTSVPEPSSASLLGTALAGLGLLMHQKRKRLGRSLARICSIAA